MLWYKKYVLECFGVKHSDSVFIYTWAAHDQVFSVSRSTLVQRQCCATRGPTALQLKWWLWLLLTCEGPDNDQVQRHTLRKDRVLDRKGGVLDRKRSASRPRKFEARGDSRSRCSKTDEVLSAGYHSEGMHLHNIMLSPNHNANITVLF